MAKFQTKRHVVEAVRFFKEGDDERVQTLRDTVVPDDPMYLIQPSRSTFKETILPGYWLVNGPEGEFYSCTDTYFKNTYEPVDE